MSEPITVWQLFSDGSHAHRDGKRCWDKHGKKVDWKGYLAFAGFVGVFTIVVHFILKSHGL